jgi:hypothetical protein
MNQIIVDCYNMHGFQPYFDKLNPNELKHFTIQNIAFFDNVAPYSQVLLPLHPTLAATTLPSNSFFCKNR